MLRTIKAYSLEVNHAKWAIVEGIAQAYAAEKADHLQTFNDDALFGNTDKHEQFRDCLLDMGYASAHNLQARMWKLALKDAYETVLKNWATLAVELRSRIQRQSGWSKAQKQYALWLCKDEKRLARLIGEAAPHGDHIELSLEQRRPVQNYIRREVRRHRGNRSQIKSARSFTLDQQIYDLFEEKERLYISLSTLTPHQRVKIPLTGVHTIRGNIRVVLDHDFQRVEVHYTAAVDVPETLTGDPAGLDAGLTEVFTDDQGLKYGAEFGQILEQQSDEIGDKGKKRNKLHALEKKYRKQGKRKKANNLRKFNLGTNKQRRKQTKMRIEIERQVNTEINHLLEVRQPEFIIAEKSDIRGKAQSKRMSRRVSSWARGTVDERLEFKASAGDSNRKHVNPAYSSQTCPHCGYVDKRNVMGMRFSA